MSEALLPTISEKFKKKFQPLIHEVKKRNFQCHQVFSDTYLCITMGLNFILREHFYFREIFMKRSLRKLKQYIGYPQSSLCTAWKHIVKQKQIKTKVFTNYVRCLVIQIQINTCVCFCFCLQHYSND